MFSTLRSQRGFSLIEVMIAVAVLGFGLLALAALQTSIIRSSSEAKAQSVAIALAKEKIESFRRYSDITGFQNIPEGQANGIGSDTPAALGGVQYARSWRVDRYVFDDDIDGDGTLNEANDQAFVKYATSITGSTPAGYVENNEFKVIKVTVSWTDANGANQSVVLDDAISALSPRDSALTAKTPLIAGPRVIPYQIVDPAGDSFVVPVAFGDGQTLSAATNPKPQKIVGVSTVETKFEVLTYAGLSGGTATAQQRVETRVVGCTCKYGAGGATPGMRPTYWNGYRYAPPVSASAAPLAGIDKAFETQQSTDCSICCRDHQDPPGEKGPAFSPRLVSKNTSTDVITSNHLHYTGKSGDPVTSGSFKDACRLIRVDGIWRVAADLSNDYFGLLATGDGSSANTPIPDKTSEIGTPKVAGGAVKRYQNFVLDYLKGRVVTPTPAASTAQSTYNSIGTPATLAASAPYVLDEPIKIPIPLKETSGKWLHAQGLYVDYLEPDAVQAITDAKALSSCNSSTAALTACILRRLSFTVVNLTELADWSSSSSSLTVTNWDYSTSRAATDPVRGKVTTSAATAADIDAITVSRKSNSGLLDLSFDSISPTDDAKHEDRQTFAVGGGAAGGGPGNGIFYVTRTYSGTNDPAVNYLVTGASSTVACEFKVVDAKFECNVLTGSATAGLDVAGGLSIEILNYNHQQPSATDNTSLTNCTGPSGQPAKSFTGAANQVAAKNSVCKYYQVTTTRAGASYEISNVGKSNESTLIKFSGAIPKNPTTTIPVDVAIKNEVQQTASACTYTCTEKNCNPSNGKNQFVFSATYPSCP